MVNTTEDLKERRRIGWGQGELGMQPFSQKVAFFSDPQPM